MSNFNRNPKSNKQIGWDHDWYNETYDSLIAEEKRLDDRYNRYIERDKWDKSDDYKSESLALHLVFCLYGLLITYLFGSIILECFKLL